MCLYRPSVRDPSHEPHSSVRVDNANEDARYLYQGSTGGMRCRRVLARGTGFRRMNRFVTGGWGEICVDIGRA